jgi:hypothetical protein
MQQDEAIREAMRWVDVAGQTARGWLIPLGLLAIAVVFDLTWLAAGVLALGCCGRGCP